MFKIKLEQILVHWMKLVRFVRVMGGCGCSGAEVWTGADPSGRGPWAASGLCSCSFPHRGIAKKWTESVCGWRLHTGERENCLTSQIGSSLKDAGRSCKCYFLTCRLLLGTLCDLGTLTVKLHSGCSVHLQRHSGEKKLSFWIPHGFDLTTVDTKCSFVGCVLRGSLFLILFLWNWYDLGNLKVAVLFMPEL